MEKMFSNLYVGITLTFATRIEGELAIQDCSFLAKETTLSGTVKFAGKIGRQRRRGYVSSREDFIEYLGLRDVFAVVGPIGHGAMMGQTSKFGYKNIEKLRKTIRDPREYVVNRKDVSLAIDDFYIVRFVYFLGSPVPYKSRRALICWAILKSSNKSGLVDEASKLARSVQFKQKIVLRDYEKEFSSDLLQFVGIQNVIPVYEKLRVGNCFLYGSKKIRSTSEIRRIAMPAPTVFKEFFKEFRSWYGTISRRLTSSNKTRR